MNERIRELAEQADAYAWQQIDEGADYDKQPQFFAEKFAVLIVKECADFAYRYSCNEENVNYYREMGWECLPGDLRTEMKKHFGVEQ